MTYFSRLVRKITACRRNIDHFDASAKECLHSDDPSASGFFVMWARNRDDEKKRLKRLLAKVRKSGQCTLKVGS